MTGKTFLESFRHGTWRRVGWVATHQRSAEELRSYGAELAELGGRYRLVRSAIGADEPPVVIHEYPTSEAS